MSQDKKKVAMLLAGGGVAALEFETGALKALWDLGLRLENIDFITGVSAGSIVASLLANNLSPHMIDDAFHGRAEKYNFPGEGVLFKLNKEAMVSRFLNAVPGVKDLMGRAFDNNIGRFFRKDKGDSESSPSFWGDLYNEFSVPLCKMDELEAYLSGVLTTYESPDGFKASNSFDDLAVDLVLSATDLNTKHRILMGPRRLEDKLRDNYFGSKDRYLVDVPVSQAMAASSTIPGLYGPREIQGRYLIDGGVSDTANADLAVTLANADLLIVMNPLKPYLAGGVEQRGVIDQAQQAYRMMIDGLLKKYLKYLKVHHNDLPAPMNKKRDIILIEPEDDDDLMFHHSVMKQKEAAVKHGYERVMAEVGAKTDKYRRLAQEYGIELKV